MIFGEFIRMQSVCYICASASAALWCALTLFLAGPRTTECWPPTRHLLTILYCCRSIHLTILAGCRSIDFATRRLDRDRSRMHRSDVRPVDFPARIFLFSRKALVLM